MDEIKYLKDTKVEITARRIDNDVYIHQASVIELLKEYKQQFSLQGVVKSLKDKPTQTFDEFITGICKNRGITLINNYTKETIGLSTLIEKWKATNT